MLISDFVQSDSVLNLAWLVMGLAALALVVRIEWRRSRDSRSSKSAGNHLPHIVGVAMIVAALFPYISATDDILQIERWHAQTGQPIHSQGKHQQPNDAGRRTQSDTLIRLYEAIDSAVFVVRRHVALTLSFVAMTTPVTFETQSRSVPFFAGRSPPSS